MTRRLLSLWIALMAVPGLLLGRVTIVEHEHEGGADPHTHCARHANLVRHAAHAHSHPHAHPHAHPHGSDGVASDSPSDDDAPRDGDEPDDGDRHAHVQTLHAAAVRRASALGGLGALRVAIASVEVLPAFAASTVGAHVLPPSPAERRGHPPSRTERMNDRLVQGIGLLI